MHAADTMTRTNWVVLNQSHSPTFQRLLERLAETEGKVLLVSGVRYPIEDAHLLEHVAAAPYDKRSNVSRALSWAKFSLQATIRLARLEQGTFVLAVTNPPVLPNLAWIFHRLRGLSYAAVYWDIYPDHMVQQGLLSARGPAAWLWRRLNEVTIREADFVITISEQMAAQLRSQYRSEHADGKIAVIHNWADVQRLRPIPKEKNPFAIAHGQADKITVMYSGNLGATHGLDALIRAAELLQDDRRFRFVIVGSGHGRGALEQQIQAGQLENILVLDKQPWDVFPDSLATGDIAVVAQASGTEHLSMPSKTYSALAAGCAILALTSKDSSLAHLVHEEDVGLVVDHDDVEGIASGLRRLANSKGKLLSMKKRAREAAVSRYSEDQALRRFQESFLRRTQSSASCGAKARCSRLKRAMDVAGAVVGLAIAAPVLGAAAGAILVTMGRPILFVQERPGLGEEPFPLRKFRTMRTPRADEKWFDSDANRITKLGRFLRKTSIDELPQLWNVLRGDLSLVGPRPLLKEYLDVYTPRQRLRHRVKPGITGWAQVNGRNELPLSERRELDVWYVENWSLLLDLKILLMTVRQAMAGRGVKPVGIMADVDDQGFELALKTARERQ